MPDKTPKYKAVLFDLDGVLVNMPEGHYTALNRALKLFGAEINTEEHKNHFNGLPTRKKLEELEKAGRLPTGLREFINNVKQRHTKEIIPKYCVPDYSKIILLKHLKNKKILLACCSNSTKETLHLMLKSAHLFDYFDVIIGNDEIEHPKPHPQIYLTALERLGVLPHESIIVEDSPHGIKAAEDAGGKVIIVRGPEDVHLSLFIDLI
jgi:beta-phosphoglucomutase-like phosphatase (HAD superfamily)